MNAKKKYLNNILSVDEGNISALRLMVSVDVQMDVPTDTAKEEFETLLKYADDADKEVERIIDVILSEACVLNGNNVSFMKQVLRYYNGNIVNLKSRLMKFANKLLRTDYSGDAEYYCNLILSVDKNCADAYWMLCLSKIGANSEEYIVSALKPIKSCSEFNKYLTLVDEERRLHCIELSNKQLDNLGLSKQQKSKRIEENNAEIKTLTNDNKNYNNAVPYISTLLLAFQMVFYFISVTVLIIAFVNGWPDILTGILQKLLFFAVGVVLFTQFIVVTIATRSDNGLNGPSFGAAVATVVTGGIYGVVRAVQHFIKKSPKEYKEYVENQKRISANLAKIETLKEENRECEAFVKNPEGGGEKAKSTVARTSYSEDSYKGAVKKAIVKNAIRLLVFTAVLLVIAYFIVNAGNKVKKVDDVEKLIANSLVMGNGESDEEYKVQLREAYDKYSELDTELQEKVENADALKSAMRRYGVSFSNTSKKSSKTNAK